MTSRSSPPHIKAPPYSARQIIQQAEDLTKEYARSVEPEAALLGISFDAVYEQLIYPKYGIVLVDDQDLGFTDCGDEILGKSDVLNNTAYIGLGKKDPRRTFTCWHEVGGHILLQGQWLRNELRRMGSGSHLVTTEDCLDLATTNALERQANLFAAHAGAPTWLLTYVIRDTYDLTRPIRYIGPREYCLDVRDHRRYYDVESFNDLCRIIARHIQFRFGWMSVEALSYRVEQNAALRDETKKSLWLNRTARRPAPAITTSIRSALGTPIAHSY
jgi:hypothetical protein